MQNIILLVVVVCSSSIIQVVRAQESNILPGTTGSPVHGSEWPLNLPAPSVETASAGQTGSILSLCTDNLQHLPKRLSDACNELILMAIESKIEQLRARSKTGGENDQFRIQHTQAVLEGQRHQGKIIFWIVLVIVALGIVAAGFQFVRSYRMKDDSGSAEIIISNNQFKFQTTWLGVLLLGMSMGFLFLYLTFVYPVSYVGQ